MRAVASNVYLLEIPLPFPLRLSIFVSLWAIMDEFCLTLDIGSDV